MSEEEIKTITVNKGKYEFQIKSKKQFGII